MKFFRTLGFLRTLRALVLPGRRVSAPAVRFITVPAPLNPLPVAALVMDRPAAAELSVARAAAAARVNRGRLQTHRNIALLSRQA